MLFTPRCISFISKVKETLEKMTIAIAVYVTDINLINQEKQDHSVLGIVPFYVDPIIIML